MFRSSLRLIFASLVLCTGFASAAENTIATLHVERGSAMTSQGGEFASAHSGQALIEGERLMLPEGASVIVKYSNDCERKYSAPGVFVINNDCVPAAVLGTSGALKVAGGVLLGAALLHSMDSSDERPPVSR